ncbi:hypothetical protein NIES4073_32780 [Kalymmatonema gypsitolerans NIES-4073]|nr:hypothetical protein NIES4073_32780 [Scytonema sp. NIES-4073]
MTNERHLLTKREALLSRGDARRMGMSFRLMPGARIALTPVKGARENATCFSQGETLLCKSGGQAAPTRSVPVRRSRAARHRAYKSAPDARYLGRETPTGEPVACCRETLLHSAGLTSCSTGSPTQWFPSYRTGLTAYSTRSLTQWHYHDY